MNDAAFAHPPAAGRHLIFLLCAGRSGSTLLYKILALHPDLAFISNFDAATPLPAGHLQRLTRGLREQRRRIWFGEGGEAHGRARTLRARLMPTPVEGERLYARCGVPLFEDEGRVVEAGTVERLGAAFERIRRQAGARYLMTKRVANNRRLRWLTRGFPQARYIHLLRDGRDVAHSLERVAWWNPATRIWWAGRPMQALLDEGMEKLAICARTWVEVVRAIDRELAVVPPAQRLELRYEELLAAPAQSLGRVYAFLGLPEDRFAIETLERLAFRSRGPGWQGRWSEGEYRTVMAIQEEWLARCGYPVGA